MKNLRSENIVRKLEQNIMTKSSNIFQNILKSKLNNISMIESNLILLLLTKKLRGFKDETDARINDTDGKGGIICQDM